jgi:hypothetical protein
VEKPEETRVIGKEKEAKRKENRPAGKVENAMKPRFRFPLSHRAYDEKPRDDEGENPNQKGKAVCRPPSSTAGPDRSSDYPKTGDRPRSF